MTGLSYQGRSVVGRIAGATLAAVVGVSTALAGPAPGHASAIAFGPAHTSALGLAPTQVSALGLTPAEPVGLPVRTESVREQQWQLDKLDAKAAWRMSTGQGVTVAVIDSGVDASHPDLEGQVLPGIDLVDPAGGDGRSDPVGHGTTVAALIAGRDNDKRGVVGLAPKAKILPVRVLNEKNRYDDALIVAKGVLWAVNHGAQVINLSLGGSGDSAALAAALDYAFARNVVVVACTGNLTTSSASTVWYPAREPGVIAVAGLESDTDRLWSGSITGSETVLTAPATGLTGARPGGYWRVQGTSFAAPLVAASAALLRAKWPDMSAGSVVSRLVETARDLGPAGRDDRFGFGLVDPVAALNGEVAKQTRNPLDNNLSPGVSGFGRAPHVETSLKPTQRQSDQLGMPGPADHRSWAARPAGSPAGQTPERFWGGGALFVALLVGSVLLLRRSRRSTNRDNPARR
ncbi:type VII secretion-associated serine protease mycosin [Micromonospora sp. NPDC003197]